MLGAEMARALKPMAASASMIQLRILFIIDFFMIDRPEIEPGVDEAVHQARIIMQPDAVVALRDMLNEHIERFYARMPQ